MLWDIHTHQIKTDSPGVFNFDVTQHCTIPENTYFSAGLHPWNIEINHIEWYLSIVERIARHSLCVAIGECGLDYKNPHNKAIQREVFEQQLKITTRFRLPVIIHCVRAYHDLLHIRKYMDPDVPWILHGFRQNIQLARQCLDAGMFISLGAYVLSGKYDALISFLPSDRLFIETDEWSGDVRQLYSYVAVKRGLTYDMFVQDIHRNIQDVFSKFCK